MKKLGTLLPFIWILIGIALFLYGRYGYELLLDASSNTIKMEHAIVSSNATEKNVKEKNKQASFDASKIRAVKPKEYAENQLKYADTVNKRGIGSIYIPSSGIQTKVLAGMSNRNLTIAVGTFRANQKLGKGNYVVLAHNLVQGGGTLKNLRKTKINSWIYATDFSKIYVYKVRINKIENEANGQLLKVPATDEKSKITLFRCEGRLNTPNRAVVQGEFIKAYAAKKANQAIKEGLGLVMPENQKNVPQKSKNSKSKWQQNDPIYNKFQTNAIQLAKSITQSGYLVGGIYLIVLFIIIFLSRRWRK